MPAQADAIRLRSLAADKGISEDDFRTLVNEANGQLDEFIARLDGDNKGEAGISRADFKVLLNEANRQIDEFLYKHTGRIAD